MRESVISAALWAMDLFRGAMMYEDEGMVEGETYFHAFCARWCRHCVCLSTVCSAVFAVVLIASSVSAAAFEGRLQIE